MPEPFLLDTNNYFLFFQYPKPRSYFRLTQKIKAGAVISFYISEIIDYFTNIETVLPRHSKSAR